MKKIKKKFVIAIDGPASSGKSTTAKQLADKLGCVYIDSGAMYRAVGLYLIENGIDIKDEKKISVCLKDISIEIINYNNEDGNIILLNGKDVTQDIRKPKVSKYSSLVARMGAVRTKLVDLQRQISQRKSIVMDGRDIGTVVFPNADYKFYIIADVKERARRRWDELQKKGETKPLEDVIKELEWRDESDSTRKISPLRKPDDAILIDTTFLTIAEQVNKIYQMINF